MTCKSRKNGEHSLLKARSSLMSGGAIVINR
jgi:hypothetical protein